MYYVKVSGYYGQYRAGTFEAKTESQAVKQAKELHKPRKLRGFKWDVVSFDEYNELKKDLDLDKDYPPVK